LKGDKVLHLIGEPSNRRFAVGVFGQVLFLRRKSFEYLLTLALARTVGGKLGVADWVKNPDFEGNPNVNRHIHFLRGELGAARNGAATRGWIENSGNGAYRLALSPDQIEFDWPRILEIGSDMRGRVMRAHVAVQADLPATVEKCAERPHARRTSPTEAKS